MCVCACACVRVCACVCVRVCAHPAPRRSCAGRSAGLPAPKVMSRACRHPNQRPSAHPSLPGWALRSTSSILPPGHRSMQGHASLHLAPSIVHGLPSSPSPTRLDVHTDIPPVRTCTPISHPSALAHRYPARPDVHTDILRLRGFNGYCIMHCCTARGYGLEFFFQTPHYHAMRRYRAPTPDLSHRLYSRLLQCARL